MPVVACLSQVRLSELKGELKGRTEALDQLTRKYHATVKVRSFSRMIAISSSMAHGHVIIVSSWSACYPHDSRARNRRLSFLGRCCLSGV
jgi:hypothetical protein